MEPIGLEPMTLACKADALPAELRFHTTYAITSSANANDPEETRTLDLRRDRATL